MSRNYDQSKPHKAGQLPQIRAHPNLTLTQQLSIAGLKHDQVKLRCLDN